MGYMTSQAITNFLQSFEGAGKLMQKPLPSDGGTSGV
jgi:hypothetical protein